MRTLGLGASVALVVAGLVPAVAAAQDVPEGALTELGAGEGEVNVVAWPGYVEDGSTEPGRRLGERLRGGDRLPGQRHARRHVRRDVHADADRQLRRGLGVR